MSVVRVLLIAACLISHSVAAEEDRRPPGKGPLAELPSVPGEHLQKIRALGDNAWLNLGPPAADPKWGRARGRSWSSNMPAASDLGGAFVFAEGVHGFVKPDGHYMNDAWFYDANAHRWICLYPGIEVKTIVGRIKHGELTVDEHGVMVEKDGQPLPPMLIHAYGYLGYDPDRRKFALFGSQFGNYFTTGEGGVFKEANGLFEAQRKEKKIRDISPFHYDVARGRFEYFPVDDPPKGQPYGANVLVYVGSRKQFLYLGSDGAWFLDSEKKTWIDGKPQGTPPKGIDHCAAYDPGRDCVYYYSRDGKTANDNFFIYDVKNNRWSQPKPRGAGPLFCSSYESIFSYDAANDALVVIRLYEDPGAPRGVYVYDPKANQWADPLPIPADVVKTIRNGNYGFYDAKLNAYFCHFASDSTDDGTMWAYRFKNVKQ